MTVTVSSANFIRAINTGSSVGLVLPTDVPAGAAIVLGIQNRTDETTTLSSVSDPVNGTWSGATVRQGPTDFAGGTHRTWYVALTNSAALTGSSNRTVTVTFSGSISYQVVGGWVSSDAGALTFDAMATVKNDSVNDTNQDSNTAAATGAGVIIGFIAVNNSQTTNPTMDGAGESLLTTGADSGRRTFMFGETYASSGNYGFEVTLAATAGGIFNVGAFLEPAGLTKKLKLLAHSSAVGATGCTVEVFAEPSAGDLTGTKYGKATGQSWSAGTGGDSGYAVMKIPVADFGGSALAVNDTPVALVENTTHAAVRLADPYSIVIEE